MSRLNYHHLYYFWKVASEGNLTRVAQAVHVSQSALSSQIRQLEERMDTALFEREGRRLRLTEAGHRVLAYANDIFARGEELERLMLSGIEPTTQHLRIGVLSTLSRNFVDRFVQPLLTESNVQFSLHARGMSNLLAGLSSHAFDLALTNTEVLSDDQNLWRVQRIDQQNVSVIGPPGILNKAIFPSSFEGYQWVLPSNRSAIRQAFEAYCAVNQYVPKIKAEADDMAMLRLLARDSGALAVLPPVVVRDELKRGDLQEYHVLPGIHENFYAITIRRQFESSLVSSLIRQASQSPSIAD